MNLYVWISLCCSFISLSLSVDTLYFFPGETLCRRMLAATSGKPLLGQYKPDCDENGHFKKIQCHEAYCFCVNEKGIPDFSTKVMHGNPKCQGGSRHFMNWQKILLINVFV